SGITTTYQTLGESMGTAIIGIILVLGVIWGTVYAVDLYAPEHLYDEQVYQDVFDYFQKVGNIDEIKSENSTVVNAADIIIQESMGFVMTITAIIMAIVFALTFRLDDNKIKRP
ncbi:MFS transporter, partial [bacterium]|nr:MFS transporter [bacterium]